MSLGRLIHPGMSPGPQTLTARGEGDVLEEFQKTHLSKGMQKDASAVTKSEQVQVLDISQTHVLFARASGAHARNT